jgi:metal-responsive CopG/Arc/MetJ family transcriptional regulator
MKTAISIPDSVFTPAERLAKELEMSRSELYTRAVQEYVAEHRHMKVREKLDQVYGSQPSTVDPVLCDLQAASLPPEEW